MKWNRSLVNSSASPQVIFHPDFIQRFHKLTVIFHTPFSHCLTSLIYWFLSNSVWINSIIIDFYRSAIAGLHARPAKRPWRSARAPLALNVQWPLKRAYNRAVSRRVYLRYIGYLCSSFRCDSGALSCSPPPSWPPFKIIARAWRHERRYTLARSFITAARGAFMYPCVHLSLPHHFWV